MLACVLSRKKERRDIIFWFKESISRKYKTDLSKLRYFIIYENNRPIGVTGFYQRIKRKDELWLGYFGIIPKERRKGSGSKALKETILLAKQLGCKNFRVFTTSKKAEKFYEVYGFRKGKSEKFFKYNNKRYKYWPRPTFYHKKI